MNDENRWSKWQKGPNHGLRARERSRVSQDGEVEEHQYTERGFDLFTVVLFTLTAGAWWWQTELDGWARGLVVLGALVLTLYLATIWLWTSVLPEAIGRFLRRL